MNAVKPMKTLTNAKSIQLDTGIIGYYDKGEVSVIFPLGTKTTCLSLNYSMFSNGFKAAVKVNKVVAL